jgi:hypothetical protein
MIGQGSPSTSQSSCPSFASGALGRGATWWGCRLAIALLFAICVYRAAPAEEAIRLRLDWGGPEATTWQGLVAVSQGRLSEPCPLGIEADEPGSMWLDRGPLFAAPAAGQTEPATAGPEMDRLVIRQRSPRRYDGVDLLVTAPLEAKLLIAFWSQHDQGEPRWITIPLADVSRDPRIAELDDRGNRLAVRRAPGDMLAVTLRHDSLVFSPRDMLRFDVQPNLLPVEPGTELRLKTELVAGRTGKGPLIEGRGFTAGQRDRISLEVQLPEEEGVYDVLLTAWHAPWRRWTQPVRGQQPLAERRIQVLVLDPSAEPAPEGFKGPLREVEEVNPANPKWWEEQIAKWGDSFARLPRPARLPRLRKGPLGNGQSETVKHALGDLVQLAPGVPGQEVPWEAYTLPIRRPGEPHVLEVEYPSDVPQTLGISIIEPNAAGAVFPIGLDSGVDLAEEVTGPPPRPQWLRHRVIFWPKTKSPMVLIANRRQGSPAVYGRIRVYSYGEHLPAFPDRGDRPGRLLAAYLDRPLFPENFSATQVVVASGELADDWETFYRGGTRLVEYLDHVGFGGLMISVLADGSTLYPSAVLEPTPRYDTGVFQESGQDPIRKDALEMLFRLFDRRGLRLIPAMDFSTPLPELEAALRQGGSHTVGVRWVGPDGKTWLETHGHVRGMAPYYNVLDERVQEAILAAIREVVGRYADHPAFAGLALRLSAHGYAQLLDPSWGMDDATIGRFERDTEIRVPGEGAGRFAERARFLATECPRKWLTWRAQQLGRFYRRIQGELIASRDDARLYLAGVNVFGGEQFERQLRPALPRRMGITEALLRVGIDVRAYRDDPGIVLLRPERIAPRPTFGRCPSLARQAVSLEIGEMLDAEQKDDMELPFAGLPMPGSLFFHEPQGVRIASFDEKSPFEPTYTWLATQPVPAAWQNRRRFVHGLAAMDCQVMFDGGWELPMGQEEALRDVVAAYRQLPAVPFQRLLDGYGADLAQPLSIRYASYAGETYVYVVNDAPFDVTARIGVNCPNGCQMEELTGLRSVAAPVRDGDRAHWTVELKPYDLVAVRFSDPRVTLSRPQVFWHPEVQEELKSRIDGLIDRAATLTHSPPLLQVLENPDFELPAPADGEIPGWETSVEPGSSVALDGTHKSRGAQAVRLVSEGGAASLISEPFDPPTTGRLTMAVWVRAGETSPQATVQYRLEGQWRDRPFVRWETRQVGPQWDLFAVGAKDLPLEGLSRLRVRFTLVGPGEVWLDDVQLTALLFNEVERNALLKMIAPADLKLQQGQVRDCIQLLEGYWPRFLAAHVPRAPAPVVRRSPPRPDPPQEPEKPPGWVDRMRAFVPKRLRSLF